MFCSLCIGELDDEVLIPRPSQCAALQQRMDALRAAQKAEALALRTRSGGAADRRFNASLEARAAATLQYEDGALRLDQAREVLVCLVAHGDALPPGISIDDVLALSSLNVERWAEIYRDPVVARLSVGRLLHALDDYLSRAASGAPCSAGESSNSCCHLQRAPHAELLGLGPVIQCDFPFRILGARRSLFDPLRPSQSVSGIALAPLCTVSSASRASRVSPGAARVSLFFMVVLLLLLRFSWHVAHVVE